MEWYNVGCLDLDFTHQVVYVFAATDLDAWSDASLCPDDVLVNCSLSSLFNMYRMWRAGELRRLAFAHNVHAPSRESAPDMIERLDGHGCGRDCPPVIVVFQTLRRLRSAGKVDAARVRMQRLNLASTHSYMQVADETIRRGIIREWQRMMTASSFEHMVCAPCGRRTPRKQVKQVQPDDIDLALLENPCLPVKVRPTTYAFDLYNRALLHPKGMTDPWGRAAINMCELCFRDIVDNRRMPKLCLANWLYYGHAELPAEVKLAMKESTPTERLLISRARSSRISYRFTELRGADQNESNNAEPHIGRSGSHNGSASTAQRCIKGNILVVPQNSTHLNAVLPPPPEVIRDTVCVLYVGRAKPTRSTIGKLGPALARKTRIRTMIEFLIEHNIHYACDTRFHGMSNENLDLLFSERDRDSDEAIPCAIDIGFVRESEIIRAAESDYTTQNAEAGSHGEYEGILMDNVGYTMGDDTPVSYRDMKMRALSHCINGGKFYRSQSGDRFMPDFENPSLLTWLFPHLDPWGIGGFHEQSRKVQVSMEDQLKYLLDVEDGLFQKDPDFAFVYFNILQKKAVCDSVHFRVAAAQQKKIVQDIISTDKKELDRLISRLKANKHYQPCTSEEKRILGLVTKVGASFHDIPGTTGYKLKMQNEIRSLVTFRGTPAFFITLNPSDVNHPLVRLLSGDNIQLGTLERGQELTEWQRKLIVANNPGACARFFHTIITSFITTVLRYGSKERGLLGKCSAYYGTVEAQGRGTLHCHMLVWLHGHPNPQRMRDLMNKSAEYEKDMFIWLESLIKCELLGTSTVVNEPAGTELPRPRFTERSGYVHPGTHVGPQIDEVDEAAFPWRFASSVNDLVQQCNWHNHTDTCWKYLRRGEKRKDSNCRMRIDGTTRGETFTDPETGSVMLRRLHPRIANYNDVIIFLMRANMDIKHIGSGEAAKALIYYVTDYITKTSLPAHIGLSALLHAIHRTTERFKGRQDWDDREYAGALNIIVNSMISRQEVSHQQVMSYLVGGGDRYTSETYRILHFGSFERHIIRYWAHEEAPSEQEPLPPPPTSDELTRYQDRLSLNAEDNPAHAESNTNEENNIEPGRNEVRDCTEDCINSFHGSDDQISLYLRAGSVTAINQIQDYLMRPQTEPFNSMGLYEYVGKTEKITKSRDLQRINSRTSTEGHGQRGRPEESRGVFQPQHPQHNTHMLRKRTVWVIPVVLGNKMPRHDRDDDERQLWARTVLALFQPWREPGDLKEHDEEWIEAYERQKHCIPPEHMTIIHNMNVLSECRDARDKASAARVAARYPNINAATFRTPSPDIFAVFDNRDEALRNADQGDGADDIPHDRTEPLLDALDKGLGTRVRHALDICYRTQVHASNSNEYGLATALGEEQRGSIDLEHQLMRQVKRKRRLDEPTDEGEDQHRDNRQQLNRPPLVDCIDLIGNEPEPYLASQTINPDTHADIVRQVIHEANLLSNKEQLRAFEIVATHAYYGKHQLLMFIGGVGGTGKSHVVNAILRLFSLIGRRHNILVAAPTGAAAILIGGHTIHSLTLLPDSPGKNLQDLCKIWDKVDYLILDEVSMIGASFLSMLNARLQRAKGTDETTHDSPFGGINIVFTGDFGQLRPVRESPLYSHKLLNDPGLEHCRNKATVGALMGVYLWRLVQKVVLLKRNQRQSGDHQYADLLSRVRTGECIQVPPSSQASDHSYLQTRLLDRIANNTPEHLKLFASAPIIVGRKRIRDMLNLRLLDHHARSLNAMIHLYHAKDRILGHEASLTERDTIWRLPTSTTNDSLGRIPLFPGMKVMVQENLAFTNRVVNGSEGTVRDIIYEEVDGIRYAAVVYIHIPGAGRVHPDSEDDIVPIFPETSTFPWLRRTTSGIEHCSVSRTQLPLLPAYAYTDYKAQGRSLSAAIVDPKSASSLQGVYVMLSRLKTMNGLALLRPFPEKKITQRISQELRNELRRLDTLNEATLDAYGTSMYAT